MKRPFTLLLLGSVAVLLFTSAPLVRAQTLTVLYAFEGGSNGGQPLTSLALDKKGTIYGTTYGEEINGTAFALKPSTGGGWKADLAHKFASKKGGKYPYSDLILDAKGNLYGTTSNGGAYCTDGCGTVFELSPTGGGGWTETVLYDFQGGTDGENPWGGLVFDKLGNLYGATRYGGIEGCCVGSGIIFELSPSAGGGWTKTTIYEFTGGSDGAQPNGDLIFDGNGNLFGSDLGAAFELSPSASGGSWTEKTLYTFPGYSGDGFYSDAGLTFDSQGNLYGTTGEGGTYENGIVFELSQAAGLWTETILHEFTGGSDGGIPQGRLIFDKQGNLYSVVESGGDLSCNPPNGCGVIFELIPATGGGWNEDVLYSFTGADDGANPCGGLVFDKVGNLYGTASDGGQYGWGTVFELTR
jgi:uncharacterized repeat protein (TIGR03803 family)